MERPQRLYWSLNEPLKWLGLSTDEWTVITGGTIPGIFCLNSGSFLMGFVLFAVGIGGCMILKKIKRFTRHFLIKSFLLSKNLVPKPSQSYPHHLGQTLGR